MKKYKLIRKYPSLPINWKVGMKVGQGDRKDGTYSPLNSKYENTRILILLNQCEVENNPEFWEEVVEKDYEILCLIRKSRIGDSYEDNKTTISCWKKNNNILGPSWEIHSVKRLSDGEIFTVGDKVHLTNGNYYGFELKEFKLFHNGEKGHLEKHRNGTFLKLGIISDLQKEPTFFYLEDIKKTIKKPLFTTEDGVDKCEGDLFYYVKFKQYDNTLGNPFQIVRGNHPTFKYEPQYEKYFSTKEAAEEYILMNKPCLSINDVMNLLEFDYSNKLFDNIKKIKSNLTNFVKSKL